MPPARRGARDDGRGDPDGERPADLEERAEGGHAEGGGAVDGEGGDGGDAREDVEEDAGCFGHAFAQPAGASVLEVEFALGDGADVRDVAGYLEGVKVGGGGGAEWGLTWRWTASVAPTSRSLVARRLRSVMVGWGWG